MTTTEHLLGPVPFPSGVPQVLMHEAATDEQFDAYVLAWTFYGNISGCRYDGARQLTTGSELCTCTYYDAPTWDSPPEMEPDPWCRYHFPTGRCRCVWDITHPTQHHRIPNRACPAHWDPVPDPPAVPPCTCMYRLTAAGWTGGPHRASVFRIDLWCPHHGAEPRWTPTDRPWETTLGPDETTP